MKTELPIGVFDSGMGGLTVLRALKHALPQESFIYLGDTARLPYGTKSPDTILQYAYQMAKVLMEKSIKALVIACNTATTAALNPLQHRFPDLPMLGVVQPGAQAVIEATRNHRIAVMATETTIASRAYQRFIQDQLPEAHISVRACSLLVALAEEGMTHNSIAVETLRHYISDFQEEDTLLLGCTHFPVFKPLLQQLLPPEVRIVDSAEATAAHLGALLKSHDLLRSAALPGSVVYLVTDSTQRFQQVGPIFLGEPLLASQVELIDVPPGYRGPSAAVRR